MKKIALSSIVYCLFLGNSNYASHLIEDVEKEKSSSKLLVPRGINVENLNNTSANTIVPRTNANFLQATPANNTPKNKRKTPTSDFEDHSNNSSEKVTHRIRISELTQEDKISPRYIEIAHQIKDKVEKSKIIGEKGVSRSTINKYISTAKNSLGLITEKDTEYLKKEYEDEIAWHNNVATMINKKQPLPEILSYCNFTGSVTDKKQRLNGIIERLYRRKLITPAKTEYLKDQHATQSGQKLKGVAERNGVTKDHISTFLKAEAINGFPTNSLKELAKRFNQSKYKIYRDIKPSTFTEHVRKLQKKGKLDATTNGFYEACKDPEQTRRSLLGKERKNL